MARPAKIIPTEEVMLARPMIRKETRKKIPARIMEYFLPRRLRENEDALLPTIAASGGRDTKKK